MTRYILRRVVLMVPVAFLGTVIALGLLRLAPGGAVLLSGPGADPGVLARVSDLSTRRVCARDRRSDRESETPGPTRPHPVRGDAGSQYAPGTFEPARRVQSGLHSDRAGQRVERE